MAIKGQYYKPSSNLIVYYVQVYYKTTLDFRKPNLQEAHIIILSNLPDLKICLAENPVISISIARIVCVKVTGLQSFSLVCGL